MPWAAVSWWLRTHAHRHPNQAWSCMHLSPSPSNIREVGSYKAYPLPVESATLPLANAAAGT